MPSQGRRPLRPITRDILNRMTQALQHTVITHYDRLLWTAVFSLSFHACLRASEAVQSNTSTHTLQLHQIKLLPNSLTISFSSYKHSAHNTPDLTIQADPCSISCPIAALSQYLTARGTSSGPLFISQSSTPIDRETFSANIKNAIRHIGLDQTFYNTHSFRIGRATQLAQDNHPEATIRAAGRWRSTAYLQYIRPNAHTLPK